MKTVLHVITSPCGGGAEVLVRELVNRGNDRDLQSKAVYFNTNSLCAKNFDLGPNDFSLDVDFRSLKVIFLLRKLIKNELKKNPNLIIHAHLTWPMLFVPLAVVGLNIKVLFTEHATSNGRRTYSWLRFIERYFYSRFFKIICISEGTRLALEPWIGHKLAKKIVVIPNGARFYSFKIRKKPDGKINFVSIGSLFSKKGFDRTIKALAEWDNHNWEYVIVGEGPQRADLESLILEKKVNDKVKLVGWSDQIEAYLHQADIQLIPSQFEGFGLVAVEGQSTGLPVIGSNVQGLKEVLAEGKSATYLVDNPDDKQQWLNQIENCIQALNTDVDGVEDNARKNAENFSLEAMLEHYKSLYKSQV